MKIFWAEPSACLLNFISTIMLFPHLPPEILEKFGQDIQHTERISKQETQRVRIYAHTPKRVMTPIFQQNKHIYHI